MRSLLFAQINSNAAITELKDSPVCKVNLLFYKLNRTDSSESEIYLFDAFVK